MDNFSKEVMSKARTIRDSSFDGKFYTGVKTTKIYCLPSCRGKSPKEENVKYFFSKEEAEKEGFRPCKLCLPHLPINKWKDKNKTIELETPPDFNYNECLYFLKRSSKECLHMIKEKEIHKAIKIN